MMTLVRNLTTDIVAKALDGYNARQKAIASNIANSETPGYHRRDVVFQEQLGLALNEARQGVGKDLIAVQHTPDGFESLPKKAGDIGMNSALPQHYGVLLEAPTPSLIAKHGYTDYAHPSVGMTAIETTEDENFAYRNDGNGVDIEHEMVDLTRNASKFKSVTSLQGKLNQQLKGLLGGLH
ncbi:MAG: flagellar basal body rod protein FlgB [Vampirovibrionales bacterium]